MYNSCMENSTTKQPEKPRHNTDGKVCSHYARYRLTCDDYDAMYARANGCCEICGAAERDVPRKKLFVDHYEDEQTIYVRGLVCTRCNRVMSAWDGNDSWGTKLRWKEAAARYAANSWQQPRAKTQPVPAPSSEKRMVIFAGPEDLAGHLRKALTADEISDLVARLTSPA